MSGRPTFFHTPNLVHQEIGPASRSIQNPGSSGCFHFPHPSASPESGLPKRPLLPARLPGFLPPLPQEPRPCYPSARHLQGPALCGTSRLQGWPLSPLDSSLDSPGGLLSQGRCPAASTWDAHSLTSCRSLHKGPLFQEAHPTPGETNPASSTAQSPGPLVLVGIDE